MASSRWHGGMGPGSRAHCVRKMHNRRRGRAREDGVRCNRRNDRPQRRGAGVVSSFTINHAVDELDGSHFVCAPHTSFIRKALWSNRPPYALVNLSAISGSVRPSL